jgi:ABC-type phosphonate transport system ATPase subunit
MWAVVAVAGEVGSSTAVDLQILSQRVTPLAIRVKNHVRENSRTQVELHLSNSLVIGRVVAKDKGTFVEGAGIDAPIGRYLY